MVKFSVYVSEGEELMDVARNLMGEAHRFDYGFKDVGDGVAEISWTKSDVGRTYKPDSTKQMAYVLDKLMLIDAVTLFKMWEVLADKFNHKLMHTWYTDANDLLRFAYIYKRSGDLEDADRLLFWCVELIEDYDDLSVLNELITILYVMTRDAYKAAETFSKNSIVHNWIK